MFFVVRDADGAVGEELEIKPWREMDSRFQFQVARSGDDRDVYVIVFQGGLKRECNGTVMVDHMGTLCRVVVYVNSPLFQGKQVFYCYFNLICHFVFTVYIKSIWQGEGHELCPTPYLVLFNSNKITASYFPILFRIWFDNKCIAGTGKYISDNEFGNIRIMKIPGLVAICFAAIA